MDKFSCFMSVMWMSSLQKPFFIQRYGECNPFHFEVQYRVHADRPDKTDLHQESSNSLQPLEWNVTSYAHQRLSPSPQRKRQHMFSSSGPICRFTTKCIPVSCTRMVSPGSCIPEIRKHSMLKTIKQPCPLDNAQCG